MFYKTELPIWNYDGSSTYQADGKNSDVYLHPVAIYKDPFRRGNNILVLCETYKFDGTPTGTNKRQSCADVVNKCIQEEPWFGIEQVICKTLAIRNVEFNLLFRPLLECQQKINRIFVKRNPFEQRLSFFSTGIHFA